MSALEKAIIDNNSTIKSVGGTIASIGLAKAGQNIAGTLVTPAVWTIDYAANGNTPDKTDLSIWGLGFAGGPVSAAAIAAGTLKSVLDDDMNAKLRTVMASEHSQSAPFIKKCYDYRNAAPMINAMSVASNGGTAWKHPNGLWVYMTDAKGRLVHDYEPKEAVVIYRPKMPLKKDDNGKFYFTVIRKR